MRTPDALDEADRVTWIRRHARELLRGTLIGLVAAILTCLAGWRACPSPASGTPEAKVLQEWGPPDSLLEPRPGTDLPGLKRLVYRCGLFGTSTAVIYVDPRGRVLHVSHREE